MKKYIGGKTYHSTASDALEYKRKKNFINTELSRSLNISKKYLDESPSPKPKEEEAKNIQKTTRRFLASKKMKKRNAALAVITLKSKLDTTSRENIKKLLAGKKSRKSNKKNKKSNKKNKKSN